MDTTCLGVVFGIFKTPSRLIDTKSGEYLLRTPHHELERGYQTMLLRNTQRTAIRFARRNLEILS